MFTCSLLITGHVKMYNNILEKAHKNSRGKIWRASLLDKAHSSSLAVAVEVGGIRWMYSNEHFL